MFLGGKEQQTRADGHRTMVSQRVWDTQCEHCDGIGGKITPQPPIFMAPNFAALLRKKKNHFLFTLALSLVPGSIAIVQIDIITGSILFRPAQ